MMQRDTLSNGKPIRIALIDSGIDSLKGGLGRFIEKTVSFVTTRTGEILQSSSVTGNRGHEHGTAIALIIKDLCKNVRFISFPILDGNLLGNGRILLHAMESALACGPDIIHLSLGTTKVIYKPGMQRIVEKAAEKNILVVSAVNNQERESYPACLDGVVGVKSGSHTSKWDFGYNGRFFTAPKGLCDIEGTEALNARDSFGNSMAAAYITGHIATLKANRVATENKEIIQKLIHKAGRSDI